MSNHIVFVFMLQSLDSKVNEPTWASLKSTDGQSMPSGPCPVDAGYHVTVFEDKTVTGVPDFHCFVKSGRCETMKAHKPLVCSKSQVIDNLRVRYTKFYVHGINAESEKVGAGWLKDVEKGEVGHENLIMHLKSESTQESLGRCHGQLVDAHQEQLHGRTARAVVEAGMLHGNLSLLVCGNAFRVETRCLFFVSHKAGSTGVWICVYICICFDGVWNYDIGQRKKWCIMIPPKVICFLKLLFVMGGWLKCIAFPCVPWRKFKDLAMMSSTNAPRPMPKACWMSLGPLVTRVFVQGPEMVTSKASHATSWTGWEENASPWLTSSMSDWDLFSFDLNKM